MASPSAKPSRKSKSPPPAAKAAPDRTGPVEGNSTASEGSQLDPEDIARLAYSYWKDRGGQGGSPEEDWLRAERELLSQSR